MRIVYFKNHPEFPYVTQKYWKIIETKNGSSMIELTNDSLEITESDNYFEQIESVRTVYCSDCDCEEIQRQEFDENYSNFVEKINELSKA